MTSGGRKVQRKNETSTNRKPAIAKPKVELVPAPTAASQSIQSSPDSAGMIMPQYEPARFYVDEGTRMVVTVLHYQGVSNRKISENTGLARDTVARILAYSQEAKSFEVATRKAAGIGLSRLAPQAMATLEVHLKSFDLQASLALLRGLQLLNPKTELAQAPEEEPMTDEEVERRLREIFGAGAKEK